jgi:hypothetical protein
MAGPACADRLDLVDAAYAKPGGPAGVQLRQLCSTCPIWQDCLDRGMRGEAGVWGGTGPTVRTRHGSPHWMKAAHADHD